MNTSRSPLRVLVATLLMIFTFSPFTRAADIYVLSNTDDFVFGTGMNFGKIDTTTGTYTNIQSFANPRILNLAWNPVAGNFYTTDSSGATEYLKTLSTEGALSGPIGSGLGQSQNFHGLAFRDAASPLYAAEYQGDDTGTISQTAGNFTVQADSPVSMSTPIGGRYAIFSGTLYFTTGNTTNRFGIVDFDTGAYTNINSDNALLKNMVLASDDTTLYGLFGNGSAGSQSLYTIDPATGDTAFVTNIAGSGLGTWFHGAAMIVNPVPEPSTYAMAFAGLACGGYSMWRRRKRA
jgi:hypothetical protein